MMVSKDDIGLQFLYWDCSCTCGDESCVCAYLYNDKKEEDDTSPPKR